MLDPKTRIQSELDQQGHTYRTIGDRIGITPQAVSEIVNGRTQGATARYALTAALGLKVGDVWPEADGNGGGTTTAGNGQGSARSDTRPRSAPMLDALGHDDSVAVSICCPNRGVPSSIRLGVDTNGRSGMLTVYRCEHFPAGPLGCDMDCLSPAR